MIFLTDNYSIDWVVLSLIHLRLPIWNTPQKIRVGSPLAGLFPSEDLIRSRRLFPVPEANRDRFVLSSGHGCMLQYSLLHLAGFDSVSLDDLKQFRQWGSKTPGLGGMEGGWMGANARQGPRSACFSVMASVSSTPACVDACP